MSSSADADAMRKEGCKQPAVQRVALQFRRFSDIGVQDGLA